MTGRFTDTAGGTLCWSWMVPFLSATDDGDCPSVSDPPSGVVAVGQVSGGELGGDVLRFSTGGAEPPAPSGRGRWASEMGGPGSGGDAMNQGPKLVAWPVGSEWRTRRLRRTTNKPQGASI